MATDGLNPAQFAWLAVRNAWSATRGLTEYRQEGGKIATGTWYRLYSEIRTIAVNLASELGLPVDRIPTRENIQIWETTGAKGFIQQVEVLARDRETGEIISIPFSLSGRTLRSRAHAIRAALSTYTGDKAQIYNQQILGAVYTGTYEARPSEV